LASNASVVFHPDCLLVFSKYCVGVLMAGVATLSVGVLMAGVATLSVGVLMTGVATLSVGVLMTCRNAQRRVSGVVCISTFVLA
jgi:hypothetical protein